MKKALILLGIMSTLMSGIYAQTCGTCTPNPSCYLPGGTQCPLSGQSPLMYQYQPYSTDVTFYMPADTNISGIGNVQIINVEYVSISGLPLGITWQCNNAMNGCNYNPYGGEQLACIRFCGTPLSPPGTYTATINIVGTANVLGGITQAQTLQYDFIIAAPASGNPYFNYTVQNTCDSADVDFSANVLLGPPQIVEYDWNFGNGQTSTLPTPPTQHYVGSGIYTPTLNTRVYNTRLKSLSAQAHGGWFNGDIEEPFSSTAADLQFFMAHPPGNYSSSEIGNNPNPVWNNLNVVLQNWALTFTFVENDPTSPDDQGGSTTININGPGTYNGSTTAITSGGGGVNFSIVIDKAIMNNNFTTDTFEIFDSPLAPSLQAFPNDTVCAGNQVSLQVPAGNYKYDWYKNGILFDDTTGNMVHVNDSGLFHVVITDLSTGCFVSSDTTHIVHLPAVQFTSFTNNAGVLVAQFTDPSYTYQWLYNGMAIFPNGTGTSHQPSYPGNYALVATNSYGCSDTSTTLQVSSLFGLEEQLFGNIQLYPNPAQHQINLQFIAYASSEMQFQIIDAMGKVLFQEQVFVMQGNYTKSFQIQSLNPGFYMIKASDGKQQQIMRFIKN